MEKFIRFASMDIDLKNLLEKKNVRLLARLISLVENEVGNYDAILRALPPPKAAAIGITGPPGAGKSTLTDALIEALTKQQKSVAVICVDPSSPFHHGALLGDRIRMNRWYNHPSVYIRSLASRGSLGGLHPNTIEVADVLKSMWFDYVIVETVGVGQSEVDIVKLADVTAVVLVPEAGDDIQTMKAGLMEIADVFVVNKSDRPGADEFAGNVKKMIVFNARKTQVVPVIKTVAHTGAGIDALYNAIENLLLEKEKRPENSRRAQLEKAYYLLTKALLKKIDRRALEAAVTKKNPENIYAFVKAYAESCY